MMTKHTTIRLSNAAPAWPHELLIEESGHRATTFPFGSIERLMWRVKEEYIQDTILTFETITCDVRRIREV